MTSRPLESHFKPLAADPADRDVVSRTVWIKRNEHLDPSLYCPFWNRYFMPRRSPRTFFSDVADEQNVARGLDLYRVHRTNDRQQNCKSARVVANARRIKFRAFTPDFDVGAFRKNRIQMRGDGDQAARFQRPFVLRSRFLRRRFRHPTSRSDATSPQIASRAFPL